MQALFTREFEWLWTVALGVALFFPVRQLIWTLSVRRLEAKQRGRSDETQRTTLKKRATVTSILLCFVFSLLYVSVLFKG